MAASSPLLQLNGSSTFLPPNDRPILAKTRVFTTTNLKVTYLQSYFVTIATILGTGILGLPVTLSHAGLYPFLVSFLIGYLVQVLLIILFVDLLQKAHAIQISVSDDYSENIPLTEFDEDSLSDLELEAETSSSGPVLAGHIVIPKEINLKLPNLHLLGELFLGWTMRHLFFLVLLVQFVAVLICYALAGSQAYAQIIGVDYYYVIPVFSAALTSAIVFALTWIQPLVSLLTLVKGSLIVATVSVTFFVGTSVSREITNDFSHIAQPFLMGTVALGGIINVMPMLYGRISPVRKEVSGFRTSVLLGLTTCALLNILWCWAVLDIVPQFDERVCMNSTVLAQQTAAPIVCLGDISLEGSAKRGEISTVPLTKMLQVLYPQFSWLATLIQLFIMISITVSYLTIGAALHHTLKGWVESAWSSEVPDGAISKYTNKIKVSSRCCSAPVLCSTLISLVAFTAVFAVAMLNPKGFVQMLDKLASSVINLESGFFIFLMLTTAFNSQHKNLSIPLPLPPWAHLSKYILPLYFLFAVGYDVYISIYSLINVQYPDVADWMLHPISVLNQTENSNESDIPMSTAHSKPISSHF